MFEAAVAAAQPQLCLPHYLPPQPQGRLIVLGAGKASAAMARTVEEHWQGDLSGIVVTRYGHAVPCQNIEIIEAAHPVPDQAGCLAAKRILDLALSVKPCDTVLCLISGGASALLPMPLAGISLPDKQSISKALLSSGATISEMNSVRRHLSALKGGRLAAACYPAKVVNLLISDVPGDHLADIGSGPTVADETTTEDAFRILARYEIKLPSSILAILQSGQSESLKPDDKRLATVETHLIVTPQKALEAAAKVAIDCGWTTHILGDSIQGEAREVGKFMAGITAQVVRHMQPFLAPCILLSGGETSVTIRGNGCGGRNAEYLLSLGVSLQGMENVWAIAADTDGIDGSSDAAGAILSPDSLSRAWARGINPQDALDRNDGHSFFNTLGDTLVTGPTLTNVNDFRAVLIAGNN